MDKKYAIVGRSYLSLVNASTLLACEEGRRRVGDRKLIVIGGESPWLRYAVHEMGQPPCLLSLPAFASGYAQYQTHDPLSSAEFASLLRQQIESLKSRGVEFPDARVVDAARNSDGTYSLRLGNGADLVTEYVDFCMGAGPARLLALREVAEDSRTAYLAWAKMALLGQRSTGAIQTADQFLMDPDLAEGLRVGVYGTRGVAALCVDVASGNTPVTWMGRDRADLAQVLPLWFREQLQNRSITDLTGCELDGVRYLAEGRIEVRLGDQLIELDRLVLAMGSYSSRSQAADLGTEVLTPDPGFSEDWRNNLEAKRSIHADYWLGATDETGSARFFGPGFPLEAIKSLLEFRIVKQHLDSLWCQLPRGRESQVADFRLIPVQATAVAMANGYLSPGRGPLNVNTAFREEFADPATADTVIAERQKAPLLSAPGLSCFYPPAGG